MLTMSMIMAMMIIANDDHNDNDENPDDMAVIMVIKSFAINRGLFRPIIQP